MAQAAITSFYTTRKRFKDPGKSSKREGQLKLSETILKDAETSVTYNPPKRRTANNKGTGKNVNKVTNYLKILEPSKCKDAKDAQQFEDSKEAQQCEDGKEAQQEKTEIPRTPKRNLSSPDELTPSKKKSLISHEANVSETATPGKLKVESTPKKHDPNVRRKLHYASPKKVVISNEARVSPQKAATYENMSNQNLASLVNESRSKVLFSGRLDELKKSLTKFSSVSAKTKEFQSNSCKITSVISSAKKSDSVQGPSIIQGISAVKEYSYLATPETESLILPYKYKLLGETFRCLDTVVGMLNNRKEKITFEKVQNGVQKMMNKNFLKNHLGQIMTVFSTAYALQYEKNDSYIINKTCPYQLIIIPLLHDGNDNSTEPEVSSKKQKKKKGQSPFIHMTPQHLLDRKKHFFYNLTEIVKKHHQDFLTRLNFPAVSDKIVRWHPKFAVDSVPDISIAALPEEPETKVSTAKDVLNKIRGSVRGKVEKALQSVVDSHKTAESKEKKSPKGDPKDNFATRKENSALKGICTDLLEKIRARESAKLIENMTRSIGDEKRSAMLERIPKIAHILWHYFVAERKAAVPVDTAVDKVIHSFNSLTTPDEVKEHLQLITETMPDWLSFIKIPKGEYITMDKRKDINVMLDNLK